MPGVLCDSESHPRSCAASKVWRHHSTFDAYEVGFECFW